jgi:hypothetical protein
MRSHLVWGTKPPSGALARSSRCALLLALALSACNGGSTGTSTGNPNDGSGNAPTLPGGDRDILPGDNPQPGIGEDTAGFFCKGEATVLDSTSAVTELGFSAADVLAFAAGTHEEPIRWHDNDIATLGPEKGEHVVTITLGHDDGEIRWMTPATAPGGNLGGPEPAIAPADGPAVDLPAIGGCRPWLEIDVQVTIKSDGGALDESFDATLRTRNKLLASLYANPDPDELGGTFAPEEILQPGFELVQLSLDVNFTPFGVNGIFNGVFQVQRGDSVGGAAGANPFAEIGRRGCSGYAYGFAVALDDVVEGASGQDMLQLVKSAHDLAVSWSDGTSTTATLSFAPTQDGACVLVDDALGDGARMNVDGQLALVTADGRVAANWNASARAELGQEDGARSVQLEVFVKDLTDEPGLPGVDVSEYDGANFNFMMSIDADEAGGDASSVMGELKVIGFQFADCVTDPGAPTPETPADMPGAGEVPPDRGASGGGTAGCRGSDPVDVLSGAFTLAQ